MCALHSTSFVANTERGLLLCRNATWVRQRRLNHGLTLAVLACITRQKVIAIDKGERALGMMAYA
jgi:hypothetical protein